MSQTPKTELRWIATDRLIVLKRNPQYMTESQMEALKRSIARDGFCAPILVRPVPRRLNKYEIISGNHRYMAACEVGMKEVPCVIAKLDDENAKRLAVNLNTIHGEPTAELLAPFLAEIDEATLKTVHLEKEMMADLMKFDSHLAETLKALQVADSINTDSPLSQIEKCVCPKCGKSHVKG